MEQRHILVKGCGNGNRATDAGQPVNSANLQEQQ
jgi:hypothetical protein